MTMKNVVRTWFFLDDILNWYGAFNRVRNTVFEQHELRPGSLPASTGVRGRNPAGTALTAAVWAVKPHDETNGTVHFVPSPQQCAATAYGSAFSRAVEINSGGFRQLLVSGTASIEPGGMTVHVGEVRAQIELTMQVAGAILESRGLDFSDVSRATAYFKSGADLPAFQGWLEENHLLSLPVVNACCEICRDDLLFEIELDAIAAGV
jgi:enamine deaminase RidA (YjgF/YER057c/UK114 family)